MLAAVMPKKSLKFRVSAKAIIPAANPQYQNSALHPAAQLGLRPEGPRRRRKDGLQVRLFPQRQPAVALAVWF